jgi:hypothetical protein
MSRFGKFFFVLFGGTYGAKGDTSGDTFGALCCCIVLDVVVRGRTGG